MPKRSLLKKNQKPPKLKLRELADILADLNSQAIALHNEINDIWQKLHTVGLDECGPIVEREDDILF